MAVRLLPGTSPTACRCKTRLPADTAKKEAELNFGTGRSNMENASILASSIWIGVLFSVCSIGMVLINKAVISLFTNIGFLLILQNSATIALVLLGNRDVLASAKHAVKWSPCALLFCLNILSSLQSMAYVSVPTFTILRNTQPIIAVGIDYVLRREITSADSIMFLMAVLAGTVLYCWSDVNFHAVGHAWALVHVMSMSRFKRSG